ncbi:glutathione S-transferase 1-like [Dermacentor andersoni]|uniref:glutathione S-transferase 1-like n=1 Tax=Dermacentor andersoni TaxID=34620 RepID=UPI003B3A9B95
MPTEAPVLYNLPGSPPCGFVRSLAKYLGIEITLKNLDFAKKEHLSEEYLKINPFHKVPTLVDEDNFIVYESNAIAYYLLRKHAPESDLYPKCYKERARIDIVLAAVASTIQPFQLLFFRPRFWDNKKPSDEEVAAFETNVVQGLQYLVSDGKYATGDNLTLADFCLVANLTICLENGSVDTSKFPKLTAYYERMKTELPYFEEIYRPGITYLQQRWSELK